MGVMVSFLPRTAQWKRLLEETPDFRRWYDNLARGSLITAQVNARTLYRFSKLTELSPTKMVEIAKNNRREFENLLFDYVTDLQSQGKGPSYIAGYVKCVKSWLRFNDIILVRKIKIGNTSRTPSIEDERVPTKDELKQILNYAKERGRCSISLIAFSGLRPQVLGNSTGTDGLEIRDFPELEINDGEVSFSKTPTMVLVRHELSKAKHKYHTFLGPEGCEYLKAYFEKRIAQGEKLTPGSAVIAYRKGYGDTGFRDGEREDRHITRKTLTKEIRDAMRPKYEWRPYVLRAYFDTQLLVAENNGKIAHAYRQFFMGHKGDIEARYTTNKGRLPENVIDDMRGSYRKSLEYLETRKTQIAEDKLRDEMRRQLLLVAGFSIEEIDELDNGMSDEEFQERVRRKLLGPMNNGNSQKVINMDELAEFLEQGWNFVATIKNDKAIVKHP
jgi:hypothetical protein